MIDTTPPPKDSKETSVAYGTLQNEGYISQNIANGKVKLRPRLRMVLMVVATLVVAATIVMVAVFGSTTESGNVQVTSTLTDRERALAILSRVPLIDGHNDFFRLLDRRMKNKLETVDFSRNVNEQWGFSQTDIPRMRQGMLGAQFWGIVPQCSAQVTDALRISLELLDTAKRFIAQYNDTFTLVTTSQVILETFENGKIANLLSIEGGHSIDSSLATLRMFYDLGVRCITLNHDCNTPWGDSRGQIPSSVRDVIPRHGGLTEFGKIVVKEMNRLGMMVDLSHTADDAIIDTLTVTTAPVIISHSAALHLCNTSDLNINENILQRVQNNNGIVMVNFVMASVNCVLNQITTPTLSSVADHIDWIKDNAGPDHVGIGGNYDSLAFYGPDGIGIGPINPIDMEGLEDVSHYPELFTELASRGWTDEELEKLAGRNLLRVFSQVEEERDRLSTMIGPIEDLIPEADIRDLPCRSEL